MQEIKAIISKYDELKLSGQRLALAIVVNVEQSSYRRSGARMLISENGQWVGGISGGCLEGDTLKKAQYSIHKGKPVKVTYDTRDGDPNEIGIGLGCNGLIDVLITPIINDVDNPVESLRRVLQRRKPSIIITDLESGLSKDYTEDTVGAKLLKGSIEEVITARKSKLINNSFVEFIPPAISLYVYGKNYDVVPLAEIVKSIGWQITLVTHPSKVNHTLRNRVDQVIDCRNTEIDFDDYSVALLMSHDYKTDLDNLERLQKHALRYIGLLGPKKRKVKMLNDLKVNGVALRTDNIYGPMGLDTGATSPEEIAISIIAEIRACFENRDGNHLRLREGPIND